MILKGKTQAEVDREKHIAECKATIDEHKAYLAQTDWVVAKCGEYTLRGEPAPIEKYQDVLNRRQYARDEINRLEQEVANAGTL